MIKETTMLYKYPCINTVCVGNTGNTVVDGEKYDYIIVLSDEISDYIKDGWNKTACEAKSKSKKVKKTKEVEEAPKEDKK